MNTPREFTGRRRIQIGCAGWSIARAEQSRFPESGSHLERYASVLPAVEINSSFYRSHRPATYARWAESVPGEFRFAVKVPKAITHEARLRGVSAQLDAFLAEVGALGDRLGALLVQLPPSLLFDASAAGEFFRALRARSGADVACEPRHPSWFGTGADALLVRERIARVAADPPPVAGVGAEEPGGWPGLVYYRLHGSPKRYYSAYSEEYLCALAPRLLATAAAGVPAWCIFDNTAAGAALPNALTLLGHTQAH